MSSNKVSLNTLSNLIKNKISIGSYTSTLANHILGYIVILYAYIYIFLHNSIKVNFFFLRNFTMYTNVYHFFSKELVALTIQIPLDII